jgi:1-phosphatidylinositol-3-phosphate 5-kinase
MLTNFWSERSASGWAPLDYPFAQIEHVWEDSDIIVREDEPSSIIGLALSSPDYLAKLQSFRDAPAGLDAESMEGSIERNLLHDKNTNIRYGFANRGVKAQCKIFYAQSFDALRRKCGVADRFVESLSRCSKFESKGGKSKSIFLKTLDDRFILKSLSPIEVQAFFRFAPNYFAFTHQNLFRQLPSVIAKMFGLFQVQIKTPTGRDFDSYLLVMENLFYDREPNRRYDLKGSMRNRKIQSTGERDEVLLDENLVDLIYSETPIFVREHTKKLLKASVWNDTLFLSQNNVMDYSLMAGFDDDVHEIIVGIIDCIRTYTWDKKLESWIKDRGKNKPTITSPKDYRNRFRIAMEKYILQAPNCWHQFAGRMAAGGDRRRLGIEGSVTEGHSHQRNVSLGSTAGYGGNGGHSRGDSLTQRSVIDGMENMGDEIARAEARKIK